MKSIMDSLVGELKEATREAVAGIMAEIGIENCLAKLDSLPAQIKAQETAFADARRGLEEAKANLDLAKQIIVAMVAEEKNGNDKARYSNAEARNAEAAKRLAVDPDYLEAKKSYQVAEDDLSSAQFELNRLHNEFGAYKIVGQMLAAKMQLLAGL